MGESLMNCMIDKQEQKRCCYKSHVILAVFILATLAIWFLHLNSKLFFIINAWHVFLPNVVWNMINTIAAPKLFILSALLMILTVAFKREEFKRVVLLLISFYALFFVLKISIHEARPFVVLPANLVFFLPNHQDTLHNLYVSFPSGHAGMIAIFAFTLIRLFSINCKIAQFILFLLIVLVAITRVATGWHWPVDVLTSSIIAYILVQLFFCCKKCLRAE